MHWQRWSWQIAWNLLDGDAAKFVGETELDYRDVERLHRDWPKQHQWRAASRDPSNNFQVGWPYIYKKNGEKAKIMCGVAMKDFPHRFLSPADLKVVVTVCRSIFKFDLTLLKIWKKLTHRLWRDVGSHSLLWSSVKLCCHKRNLEEMPQILSSSRCHIFIHYSQNSSLTITTYRQLQSGLQWSEKSHLWPKSQMDCLIRWHTETELISLYI